MARNGSKAGNGAVWPGESAVPDWTDTYFKRSKETIGRFGDATVTYALFMRRPVVSAPRLAIDWLQAMAAQRNIKVEVDLRFDEGRSFMEGLAGLRRALRVDIDWLREHTRLSERDIAEEVVTDPAKRDAIMPCTPSGAGATLKSSLIGFAPSKSRCCEQRCRRRDRDAHGPSR